MKVLINTVSSDINEPKKATEFSSGFDLQSVVDDIVLPGEYKLIPTGIKMAIQPGYECQIRPRSGLALKNGITVLNSPGTIDADYRGEVGVIIINHGKQEFKIEKGMRIAQAIFIQVPSVELLQVEHLDKTQRNENGFGSTGL